jgi:hypothetical protein
VSARVDIYIASAPVLGVVQLQGAGVKITYEHRWSSGGNVELERGFSPNLPPEIRAHVVLR